MLFKEGIEGLIEQVALTDFFQGAIEILTRTPSSYQDVWKILTKIFDDIMMPIGTVLFILYFLIAITEKMTMEQFNFEQLIKLLLKLVIVIGLLSRSMDILTAIMDMGNSFASGLRGNIEMADIAEQMKETAAIATDNYKSIGTCITFLIQLAVMWLFTQGIKIFINVQCYARLFEMILMIIGAPIGMSDLFSEGIHGNAIRYLKKVLAVSLQGGIIYFIGMIYGMIAVSEMNNLVSSSGSFMQIAITNIVFGMAACTAIGASGTKAKEWLGVS